MTFNSLFFHGKLRLQHEAELKRLEEETARRIEEAVRKNVEERMSTEEVKEEIERRTKEAYEKMLLDVEVQLKNEKESALNEARRKEVSLVALSFNFCCFIVLGFETSCCVLKVRNGKLILKEQARREREELDKMLEENSRRVEESQRREALELQRKEEERYRELELIQRQKEEAARRKKLEEEEEIRNSSKVSNGSRSRAKLHFGMGL